MGNKQIEILQQLVVAKSKSAALTARRDALTEEMDRLMTRVENAKREADAIWEQEKIVNDEVERLNLVLSMLESVPGEAVETTPASPAPPVLSLPQTKAMDIARAQGGTVFGGKNVVAGSARFVAAPTIFSLERLGLLTVATSPDGNIMGQLTVKE